MELDRPLADDQALGDLLVAQPLADQLQDFQLAWGQRWLLGLFVVRPGADMPEQP